MSAHFILTFIKQGQEWVTEPLASLITFSWIINKDNSKKHTKKQYHYTILLYYIL